MLEDKENFATEQHLENWVIQKCDDWRDHFSANYQQNFDEYYRLWRGIWSAEDQTRRSERSKIISPALQQAVESSVAELEEATFGRGQFFDIKDDVRDQNPQDVAALRSYLEEDFAKNKIRKGVAECLINAAVFGTGIAEIVLEEEKEPLELASSDFDIEPDQDLSSFEQDKVRLTKYYGLVPRHLLEKAMKDEEAEDAEAVAFDDEEDDSYYVEAMVVIANSGTLLKAEKNPYMMQDRPVVAFPWDVVPSRFWGRGVCEKGYNSQKALDTELRARIDALALTIHPMMAMDASRMPRGAKPSIQPGKTILTNGNPAEILQPFNFGQVNQITFAQAQSLQTMVQTATGAIDQQYLLSQ